jgi:hypothetical protein
VVRFRPSLAAAISKPRIRSKGYIIAPTQKAEASTDNIEGDDDDEYDNDDVMMIMMMMM